jgi:hypothetical protein
VHFFSLSGCFNVGAIVYLPYVAVGPINLKSLREAATEAIIIRLFLVSYAHLRTLRTKVT